jgi:hypothetical protein
MGRRTPPRPDLYEIDDVLPTKKRPSRPPVLSTTDSNPPTRRVLSRHQESVKRSTPRALWLIKPRAGRAKQMGLRRTLMRTQLQRRLSVALSALLLAASLAAAQQEPPPLTIGRTTTAVKPNNRTTPVALLGRDSAFRRVLPGASTRAASKPLRDARAGTKRVSIFGDTRRAAAASEAQSFGVAVVSNDRTIPQLRYRFRSISMRSASPPT